MASQSVLIVRHNHTRLHFLSFSSKSTNKLKSQTEANFKDSECAFSSRPEQLTDLLNNVRDFYCRRELLGGGEMSEDTFCCQTEVQDKASFLP